MTTASIEQQIELQKLEIRRMELRLELRRSMVRQVVTYVGVALLAVLLGYGVMWMGDRSCLTAAVGLFGGLLGYWFGERTAGKVYEQLVQAIEKFTKS